MSDGKWSARVAVVAAAALVVAPSAAFAADKPFQIGGPTVNLAVTGTTGRVQFQTSAASPNARLYNSGTVPVFVACGDVAVTTTVTAGMPVNGPGTAIISCPQQYIAAITSTTATLYVTPGTGGEGQ